MSVPFFRPSVSEQDVAAAVECLRSGWLTTGPRVKQFEASFAAYVGAKYAVAVSSCTAALHLALEAAGVARGDMVLVPTLTFAATAEVVRYFDAVPVFVDSEARALCMDPERARATLEAISAGRPVAGLHPPYGRVVAVIPVHYGGQMADMSALRALATEYRLALVEDAAHTLPAYFRTGTDAPWCAAGTTGDITCFSFYANKCITTGGEGGMAVTDDGERAERMRIMSLHGMSKDAWQRYRAQGAWYYEIVAPGFKYNMTDLAAALGASQLGRADVLWRERCRLAARYGERLGHRHEIVLPEESANRRHSWHLFSLRLVPGALGLDRVAFIQELGARGIAASVH